MTASRAAPRALAPPPAAQPARWALQPARWAAPLAWLGGWWKVVELGALLLALALAPSSYARVRRPALMRQLTQDASSTLLWFTLLSAFLSLVLIRIVTVTAISYGLTRYAMEMVVRVLVLELIPLAAALFVALRVSLPAAAELVGLRRRAGLDAAAMRAPAMLAGELLPRVLAGVFAVLLLALVSCVLALVLAYGSVHGLTPFALAGYTRTVGQVFGPVVSLIFGLKTLAFGVVVALIPVAAAVHDAPPGTPRTRVELRALVRMFALLLLIEAASLIGNYY
ncbi:MAG: ABC transporter permease [Burkholderiales bacterium]|nr:ABC transporter permease [Burkholderiales bacterium]